MDERRREMRRNRCRYGGEEFVSTLLQTLGVAPFSGRFLIKQKAALISSWSRMSGNTLLGSLSAGNQELPLLLWILSFPPKLGFLSVLSPSWALAADCPNAILVKFPIQAENCAWTSVAGSSCTPGVCSQRDNQLPACCSSDHYYQYYCWFFSNHIIYVSIFF